MNKALVEQVRKGMDRINFGGVGCIPYEYSRLIFDEIAEEVAEDVEASADPDFNDDDIRLAVGRVLVKRLGIEI